MDAVSPMDRLLRSNNIFQYKGDPVEDARQTRKMIDTFNRVNEIIQDPEKSRPSTSELLQENYRLNLEILSKAMNKQLGKGQGLDVWA